MLSDDQITANLEDVRARVAHAAAAADREPDEITLLLATKTMPADRVAAAIRAGARVIGENKVQELAEKDGLLADLPCERHFIGHLQTNKVNQVLRYVSCVQSVDRIELADRMQHRLETLDRTVDVLIQVNVSGEDSKSGVSPTDAPDIAREIARRDRLRITGLMTIGLRSDDPEAIRPGYRSLRTTAERIADDDLDGVGMTVLSMGMSADLHVAIAEGATMVRVGSGVFGARPQAH